MLTLEKGVGLECFRVHNINECLFTSLSAVLAAHQEADSPHTLFFFSHLSLVFVMDVLLVTGSCNSKDMHAYLVSQHPRSLLTSEKIWNEKFGKKKRKRNLHEGSVKLKKAMYSLYCKFKRMSLHKTSEILSDTSDTELVTADFLVH